MRRPSCLRRLLTRGLSALCGLCLAAAASAADASFDHGAWGSVLERFVDERGFVAYDALLQERAGLDGYLAQIAVAGPGSRPDLFPSRAHELAYYLNAYNALVFEGVLDRGPEQVSVWQGGLISGYDFFVRQKHDLDGQRWTLKALEDNMVREQFRDPRVHAALNCASRGCPRLPRLAFEGEELDRQLEEAMRFFVSEERNCRVNPAGRTVFLSRIFDWFDKDFLDHERRLGSKAPSVVDYVNRYRAPGAAVPAGFAVRFVEYDKGINAQAPGSPQD